MNSEKNMEKNNLDLESKSLDELKMLLASGFKGDVYNSIMLEYNKRILSMSGYGRY